MDASCTQSMIQLLKELDILEPIPTGVAPHYHRDDAIKAVIFDIYGPLLISESGDIDESSMTTQSLKIALDAAGVRLRADDGKEEHHILRHLLHSFTLSVKQHHKLANEKNIPFPEVNIIEIWETVVHCGKKQHLVRTYNPEQIKCLTFVFEVLSNKVYPMPGMARVLETMQNKGLAVGIVSNAQFYTPIIMNYFLDRKNGVDNIDGIDPALQIYSYKERIAKPETKLYQRVLQPLQEQYNIEPNECLFVGNDMYKDVWPAQQLGIKTALFAGDQRSLRLRREKPELKNVKPDFTITELSQLTSVVS